MLTRSQREFVSMADGRIVDTGGVFDYTPLDASLEVALGGSLVIAKPVRPAGPDGGNVGGVRGAIISFSSGSRRRLMRMIASIERQHRPTFITLTYPDLFEQDIDVWKRDIDVMGKRLARKMPQAAFIWRIEFKRRKSGENKGSIAPHFHLLAYNASFREIREFVPTAWYGVVGSCNREHLSAGSRVERIYSFGGIMRYVGKYISKDDIFPPGWAGRVWGIIGRSNMPFAVRVVISLSEAEGIKMVRFGRKMVGLKGKTLMFGLTWIMDAERALDYLEVIQGFL